MTLTPEEVEALGSAGYFTRERLLGLNAKAVAEQAAAKVGQLQPAQFGRERKSDPQLRGDRIGWLDAADAPALFSAFEALRLSLNREAFLGLTRFDVQLAWYPGAGERYAEHLDAFRGPESRRVTAICYLNPKWEPAHGGCLRLAVQPEIQVAPTLDRLVVFLSDRVAHEVLPAHAPRLAATAWYYAHP